MTRRHAFVASAVIVTVAATVELAMGRVPVCACGYVKAWHGVVLSSENSQHLTDWYTFSHVVHGMAFYALLWMAAGRLPLERRFVVAVLLEAAWEVLENTPMVIDRYRTATIALDYFGDSVLNSMADIAAMMAGFVMAGLIPTGVTFGLALAMEVYVGLMIRDNLTLNVIMLIYPVEAIKRWQGGA